MSTIKQFLTLSNFFKYEQDSLDEFADSSFWNNVNVCNLCLVLWAKRIVAAAVVNFRFPRWIDRDVPNLRTHHKAAHWQPHSTKFLLLGRHGRDTSVRRGRYPNQMEPRTGSRKFCWKDKRRDASTLHMIFESDGSIAWHKWDWKLRTTEKIVLTRRLPPPPRGNYRISPTNSRFYARQRTST